MNIHVTRDGQNFGPYKVEDINGYLKLGSLLPTDMAWYEGLPGWIPLFRIPGVQIPIHPKAPPSSPSARPIIHAVPALAKHSSLAPSTQSPPIKRTKYTALVWAAVLLFTLCLAFAFWPGLRQQVQGVYNSPVGARSSAQTEADSTNNKNLQPESKWHFDVPRGDAKDIKNILEVETDKASFFGKPLVIRGKIRLSSYYNFGYSEAERWHSSFEVLDGKKQRAYLYMRRAKATDLRKQLLDSGSALDGVFLVVIERRIDSLSQDCLFELLDYSLQK